MSTNQIYRPGIQNSEFIPLGRFLPRLPVGAASGWLQDTFPPGSWVIDPFGASPQLTVEAAKAGYRILVAANNPIARFLIEMSAAPPQAEDLRAVLAALASTRRGEERLEPHILNLYLTECDHCGQEISAEFFLWERESDAPYARVYTCPHCSQKGEYPATEGDLERARGFSAKGPYHSRALERVAKSSDPNRPHVEEALDAYIPRSVYGLFTLINKLESLDLDKNELKMLDALVLTACDQANTLWSEDGRRRRPKQLSTPSRFREHNIWFALENAISLWSNDPNPVELSTWPDQPSSEGGICLYEGRIRDLAPQLKGMDIKGVLSAIPRQNQAFWTLSALWAGWLWGREAVGPFVNVLRRRRYDWAWHTRALQDSLDHLAKNLPEDTPFFGMVTESEPGFDAAIMIAADNVGFGLEGLALRPKAGQTQLQWRKGLLKNNPSEQEGPALVREAGKEFLTGLGQPSRYLRMQSAGLEKLALERKLTLADLSPTENFNEIRSTLEFGFTFRSGYLRFSGSDKSLEVGRWWLRENESVEEPLLDRLEVAVVNYLAAKKGVTFDEMDTAMCEQFRGLYTPEKEWIEMIMDSYAQRDAEGSWSLRNDDDPKARHKDLQEMQDLLKEVGGRLGFEVKNGEGISWLNQDGEETKHFFISASALLGKRLIDQANTPGASILVLPGGRAKLVIYKLEKDPRLKQAVDLGWRFLKFRQLRRMAENHSLTVENLEEQFNLDPIDKDDPQLRLL